MHHQPSILHLRLKKAFSLIEMLVVIAVIGVISAIALPGVSNVNDSAEMARDQRNAQNIATMFNNAKVAGVAFASSTKEEILEELIVGKTSPTNGIDFKISPLPDDAKTATLAYCEYDADQGIMKYDVEGDAAATPAAPAPPSYGPWTNFQVIYNSQLVGRLNDLRVQMPNREWQWIPTTPYIHNQSQIQYRDIY